MTSPVVVKFPTDTRLLTVDFADFLAVGETINSGSVSASSPTGLTVSGGTPTSSTVPLTIGAGADSQSYGVTVAVNTSLGNTHVIVVAVVINSQIAANYQNKNVDAFASLVGEIEAGEAALGKAAFTFPLGFDTSAGSVVWELLAQDGVVLGAGSAFDYQTTSLSDAEKVEAQAVVTVPSNALPTLDGQNYQIRWSLTLGGQKYYSFEALRVTSPNTVPEGVEDVVELATHDVPVSVVFSKPFDSVWLEVYQDNDQIGNQIPVGRGTQVADGWLYQVTLVGLDLPARIENYTLMWSAKNNANPYTERQTGRMFIVNPSILSAVDDMRLLINRSRTTISGAPDVLFTVPLLLAYLRRGRDAFNGAYGMMTAFTFTNARGPLREYWLRFTEVQALRGQFVAEGEKAFNFSGQKISLDVDRSSMYDSAANTLQQLLDNEAKSFKAMLIRRGIITGDGGVDNLAIQRPGAVGAISISISPASNFGPFGRWGRDIR